MDVFFVIFVFNLIKRTMTKLTITFLAKLIGSVIISLTISTAAMAYPSGSPAGYTGSPGDGQHCVSCHGGSAATVSGWITSNIPSQGYTAGTVYNLTVTVTGSGSKGFEVSPQNPSGTQLGTLGAGTGSKLVGGTKYVTQSSSSSSATKIWNFTWTAPAAGTGVVTFYGAFTVNKPVTKLSTLVVNENTAAPLSATATATPPVICFGQSSQLNVTPAGGSGTYTYSWSSIPAGFTSAIQNPVVSPGISTQYLVNVADGAASVDVSTDVTVNQPATASAGNDTTCDYITAQVPLNGIASNYAGILWSTSGSGTFTVPTALAGYYLPSTEDKDLGIVTLTLTASAQSPCTVSATDSMIIHFNGPVGITETKGSSLSMVLSPNPSQGRFTLRVDGVDFTEATVTILDMTGRTIIQRGPDASTGQHLQFDLSERAKGIYLVKIQTPQKSMVSKLIID